MKGISGIDLLLGIFSKLKLDNISIINKDNLYKAIYEYLENGNEEFLENINIFDVGDDIVSRDINVALESCNAMNVAFCEESKINIILNKPRCEYYVSEIENYYLNSISEICEMIESFENNKFGVPSNGEEK